MPITRIHMAQEKKQQWATIREATASIAQLGARKPQPETENC
jgi:hypothetical protein